MKSRLENIYLKSPIWLQNLAISLYGLRTELNRHHGEYARCFDQVISQTRYDMERLNVHVLSRLHFILKSAEAYVPYYRELFREYGVTADDITSLEDLRKIPILNKDVIRKDPKRLVSEKYAKKDLLIIHTTGTTGTPLKVFCDAGARQWNYAYYDRFLEQVGLSHKGKRATFGGRIVVPQNQKNPPFWRYSHFQKNMLFSSYHLGSENIPAYINKLIHYQPDYIDSYPSSIYVIASYAKEYGIDLRNVTKGITTSAETLFPEQREVVESVFDVPVFDQYGAAEMCVFVAQCKEKNYHIHIDYGIVEFLRENGEPANLGEEAEIVCTGFVNQVMPLIRYRIGDRGVLSDRQCKCGSAFPVMEKILGRMDDIIVTPDGRKVGRLSPVLKGFPVKEAQYVQEIVGSVRVLLVKGEGYSTRTEEAIINELKKRLGVSTTVDLSYVDSIPRGKGGKLKAVVSLVGTK